MRLRAREREREYQGDRTADSTARGNKLNGRVALLVYILGLLGVAWVIEQPLSSLFFATSEMAWVLAQHMATRTYITMKRYGGPTLKPTVLQGTAPWLSDVADAKAPYFKSKRVSTERGEVLKLYKASIGKDGRSHGRNTCMHLCVFALQTSRLQSRTRSR